MTDYFSYLLLEKSKLLKQYLQLHFKMANFKRQLAFSLRRVKNDYKQLMSLLVPRASYLSPWARQNFPVR